MLLANGKALRAGAKSLEFGVPIYPGITAIVWHVSIVLGAWVSLEARN